MNPEFGPLRYRPVEEHDDAVIRAAEVVINNARAFYPAFDDTFGLYFESQPPEPGMPGPITIVSGFISYELNARRFSENSEIELPSDFSEERLQSLLELATQERYAHQAGKQSGLGPANVLPDDAMIIASVGAQILDLNQAGALGARRLTVSQVSLIQHVVDTVNEYLSPKQRVS